MHIYVQITIIKKDNVVKETFTDIDYLHNYVKQCMYSSQDNSEFYQNGHHLKAAKSQPITFKQQIQGVKREKRNQLKHTRRNFGRDFHGTWLEWSTFELELWPTSRGPPLGHLQQRHCGQQRVEQSWSALKSRGRWVCDSCEPSQPPPARSAPRLRHPVDLRPTCHNTLSGYSDSKIMLTFTFFLFFPTSSFLIVQKNTITFQNFAIIPNFQFCKFMPSFVNF